MIKASIDRPKLERSLKKYAKQFGDSNAQAVSRWGVQVCRELVNDTLPFKAKGKGSPSAQQRAAIQKDIGRVMHVLDGSSRKKKRQNKNLISSPSEVIEWMNQNRTSNNRTKKLPNDQRKTCTIDVFNKTVGVLMKMAGIAKGGFIGAGNDIAQAQKGANRITIGKNVASYAHKHSRFGSSTTPRFGWSSSATLSNHASHTGMEYVLKKSSMKNAISWGLKKTVTWYRSALRKIDQQKP